MLRTPPMGTPEWVEYVFSSPPVRNNKGPSKHTHYHQVFDHVTGCFVGAEGRTEHCALQILQLMRSMGIVSRIKGQPFKTEMAEFGAEIVPDYFTDLYSGESLVIECKTEKFITREVERILESNKRRFADFNLRYLVWTDRHPLNHSTRHNLIRMAQAASSNVAADEISAAVRHVECHPRATLADLYDAGFDSTTLLSAAHSLRLHFRLNEPLVRTTQFAVRPLLDFETIYLGLARTAEHWWASL